MKFNTKSILTALLVVSPPLLSDPKQRKAYGVTHHWPPQEG